jgi:LCP family protein required for cell wall assembly
MFGRPDDPKDRRRRRPSLWVGEPPPGIQRNAGPRPSRNWLAGKAGYSASCITSALVLLVSFFCYITVRNIQDIGSSNAITSGPSIGTQNILLMGLESRRYWNGTILPPRILRKLHAGSAAAVAAGVGGNDTNTLILIHVPAGGRKAVGFSIPRDDWVQFADTIGPQQSGKIDQAYGVSMFYREQQLSASDPGIDPNRLAYLGNEAGQAAAVATVEQLTGVHIDHFAVVNLYGFYELARVLGGVNVCLKDHVYDPKSGADFRAGYQHLNAQQALAFVRQRDGLPNGDLDRTHRQQAFLDSVMQQLRQEGMLSDLTKIQALLNVAKNYVITDAGWNLLDFGAQMRDLTSKNLIFRTLPIAGYATIDGQDANAVNTAYIKAIVHAAFYPPPAPAAPRHRPRPHVAAHTAPERPPTVDVFNGGQTSGLAHRVSAALVSHGYRAGKVGDAAARASVGIYYGKSEAANAIKIARLFGVKAAAASATVPVPAGHVDILLGASTVMPAVLTGTDQASASPSPAVSPSQSPGVVIPSTGPQGGTVGGINGIPCVN